jgi:hypothetical protein
MAAQFQPGLRPLAGRFPPSPCLPRRGPAVPGVVPSTPNPPGPRTPSRLPSSPSPFSVQLYPGHPHRIDRASLNTLTVAATLVGPGQHGNLLAHGQRLFRTCLNTSIAAGAQRFIHHRNPLQILGFHSFYRLSPCDGIRSSPGATGRHGTMHDRSSHRVGRTGSGHDNRQLNTGPMVQDSIDQSQAFHCLIHR